MLMHSWGLQQLRAAQREDAAMCWLVSVPQGGKQALRSIRQRAASQRAPREAGSTLRTKWTPPNLRCVCKDGLTRPRARRRRR